MAFGKKSLKEKFNDAARRFLLWTGLVAGVSAPFAYEYGTVKEQTVKVISYSGSPEEGYTLKTDKGTFNMERSRLHFQSVEDVKNMEWIVYNNRTYDIKTYGWHLIGGWHPNIIDIQSVSEEELKKREEAALKSKKENVKPDANGNTQPSNNNNGNNSTAPVLSGQMVTVNVIVNGYNVQITLPVEAAGKVTINSVAPVVQTNNVVPSGNTTPVNNAQPANNPPTNNNNAPSGPGM